MPIASMIEGGDMKSHGHIVVALCVFKSSILWFRNRFPLYRVTSKNVSSVSLIS